jgi:NifB/MoaA-like Fe-S oxidoreductase
VYGVKNSYFGEKITVSGLVTGGDLINALKHEALPPRILIPINMLRSGENVFLDDVTVEDVEQALGVKVVPVENRGSDLINTIMMR